MMKTSHKLTRIASALLFLCPMLSSFTASADALDATLPVVDTQDKPNDANFTQEKLRQLTVTPGLALYHLRVPSFNLPMTLGSDLSGETYHSVPAGDDDFSRYAVAPTLTVAYAFNNPGVLPVFFGDILSVDMNMLYEHTNDTINQNLAGAEGFVWPISGGTEPINNNNSNFINSTSVAGKFDHGDMSLGLSGIRSINTAFSVKPRIALVFSYIKQDYGYDILGAQYSAPTQSIFNTVGDETVSTYYFGLAWGALLEHAMTQNMSVYGDVELQALQARSTLKGSQTTWYNANVSIPSDVRDSDSVYTYRAKATMGAAYYTRGVNDVGSMKIALEGGLDFWGYMPQVVNPEGDGTEAHLDRATSLSHFVRLTVAIPLM